MTRWLDAARGDMSPLTELTKPTEPMPQSPEADVLSVLSVLSDRGEVRDGDLTADEQYLLDAWHERAAIREYDGGMERGEAERAAIRDVQEAVVRDVALWISAKRTRVDNRADDEGNHQAIEKEIASLIPVSSSPDASGACWTRENLNSVTAHRAKSVE